MGSASCTIPARVTSKSSSRTEDMEDDRPRGDKRILKREDGVQTSRKRRRLGALEISTSPLPQTDEVNILLVQKIVTEAQASPKDAPGVKEAGDETVATIQVAHEAVEEKVQGAAPEPPAVSLLASRLTKISSTEISDEIDNIWSMVRSFTLSNIKSKASQNANACLPDSPPDPLPRLYTLLFGEQWRQQFFIMNSSKSWNRRKALEACLSVAIYSLVFEEELPWPGPVVAVARMQHEAVVYKRVLSNHGIEAELETIHWEAAALSPLDVEFQRDIISPAANAIAGRILPMLELQLLVLRATDQDNDLPQLRTQMLVDVSRIVKKALILKGRMRAAPEYYDWSWARTGQPFNHLMEDLRQGSGWRQVEWAVTPRIKVKETKGSEEWETVTLAKVFTKKSWRRVG
ncbi:hypothetical protein LTR78_006398 [Recurvomyces mirabilis]|uniref:Uncharacterized protein n=1 Tax=Recurvomyces mirabilis TaxID=574656 RepID=A0AAE0WLE2_9PEZI|nr:hypothetical protein LTR78_006398 [Recurvomyces mirabilis]KAK5152285.1 hypothetical protein LTS14_008662 [Recurvomyces mirabilis]